MFDSSVLTLTSLWLFLNKLSCGKIGGWGWPGYSTDLIPFTVVYQKKRNNNWLIHQPHTITINWLIHQPHTITIDWLIYQSYTKTINLMTHSSANAAQLNDLINCDRAWTASWNYEIGLLLQLSLKENTVAVCVPQCACACACACAFVSLCVSLCALVPTCICM